eukprot:gnl/TRDRNA2_/TRDRNA2_175501_c6_seq5.p1 gnl/TRDRNA2_/TRDRNA2_175501_c6~~gnl/TRDRNA2_/TRDRNA2_175501_c6_seq5.p1  ORF type:complete len:139 (-),score=1.88 gnl/TRDRNA2_/TRDRNA2_175501_c6_seq5:466-882(-)
MTACRADPACIEKRFVLSALKMQLHGLGDLKRANVQSFRERQCLDPASVYSAFSMLGTERRRESARRDHGASAHFEEVYTESIDYITFTSCYEAVVVKKMPGRISSCHGQPQRWGLRMRQLLLTCWLRHCRGHYSRTL